MKVVQIELRTPGIFLGAVADREHDPVLVLQIKVNNSWVDVNEVDEIKVVSSTLNYSGSFATGSLPTEYVEVPRQDQPTRTFDLLVADNSTWEYRILAKPCVDCKRLFLDKGLNDRVEEDGSVVVGKGTIQA